MTNAAEGLFLYCVLPVINVSCLTRRCSGDIPACTINFKADLDILVFSFRFLNSFARCRQFCSFYGFHGFEVFMNIFDSLKLAV